MAETEPAKGILDFLMKLDGGEPKLILAEKALSASDVERTLSRLMLPAANTLSKEEYLRNEEITILEASSKKLRKEGVPAIFVDPDYKTYEVSLKQWTKFQLWSFRCQGRLHFALVPKDEEDNGYLDVFGHLDYKALNDVPSSSDDDYCFCLDDFTQLDLFHSTSEECVNVSALPDLGSFEDTDVVASYYDDA